MIEHVLAVVRTELPESVRRDADEDPQTQEDGGDSADGPANDFLLLPPEERVLASLEEYGGRMWQQDVVDETGYSEGRVSELLGEMEADDSVTRYWKGGKKVVALPEACTQV